MGLHASIYKHPLYRRCANGGISERCDEVCVVNVEGPFEPDDRHPAVILDSHRKGIVRIVPAFRRDGAWVAVEGWLMDGGAYVATSDSRFREAIERLTGSDFYGAVALHDRREG